MSRTSYVHDRAWTDRHIPRIASILKAAFGDKCVHVRRSSDLQDRHENTDLWIETPDGLPNLRVACRIRSRDCFTTADWCWDVTFRNSRPYGGVTEYTKMLGGLGDCFFYGFESVDKKDLIAWHILNLDRVRESIKDGTWEPKILFHNVDASSDFMVFDTRTAPDGVVFQSHGMPNPVAPKCLPNDNIDTTPLLESMGLFDEDGSALLPDTDVLDIFLDD